MLKKNRILANLFLFNGIFVFALSLLGPLYAVFVLKIVDDIFWVSVSWATALITSSIVVFYLSKYGDRYKDKNLLLAGYLVRAASWALFIFIGNIWQLLVLQVFLGVGEALGTPSFNAIFAEHLDDGKHIAEYSDWALIVNAVIAVATVMGALLVRQYGFGLLFGLMSILSLVAFVGVLTNKTPYDLEGYGKRMVDGFFGKK